MIPYTLSYLNLDLYVSVFLISSILRTDIHFLDPVFTDVVNSNHFSVGRSVCWSVHPSVFRYLRDSSSLVFSEILHDIKVNRVKKVTQPEFWKTFNPGIKGAWVSKLRIGFLIFCMMIKGNGALHLIMMPFLAGILI